MIVTYEQAKRAFSKGCKLVVNTATDRLTWSKDADLESLDFVINGLYREGEIVSFEIEGYSKLNVIGK